MENSKNGSSKPMLQSNDPQSDGATDMSPTSGEGTSTRNIKMMPVSDSVLDSGCQDEASKLKDVDECVKINVRYFNGSKFSVQVALESTVESFKELIVGNSGIPIQNQRLIYKGNILQNDQSLQSYGLGANHTVHLVRYFAPTDTNDVTDNSDTNTMAYDAADSEGEGLPGGDFQPTQLPYGFVNPNSVRDLLDTPTMQYLTANPDIMWGILMNNEELPQNVPIDLSILNQVLEAAGNPAILHEMLRLSDLELINIESTPDGFNMLRYNYEPNDTLMAGNGITGISGTYDGNGWDRSINIESNASSSLPNTNPLPNPWAMPVIDQYYAVLDDQTNIRGSTTDFLGLEFMLNGSVMPNDAMQTQLVQEQHLQQLIEFMPSNPEALCQFDGHNIEEHDMPDLSSLREEIQNPEFLRLQTPLSFWEEDLPPELSQQQSMEELGQTTGDTDSVMQDTAEQLYASQLSQLQEMGFNDTEENIRALILTSGDIHAAVRHLWWLLNQ